MANFDALRERVGKEGTQRMKELIEIVGLYLKDLDAVFFKRDVSKGMLVDTHFIVFFRGLEIEKMLKGMSKEEFQLLTLDVSLVARHTWSLLDKDGKTKTGDDLHKAYSPMFTGEEMMNDAELYAKLRELCGEEESSIVAQISKERWPEWPREVKL